MRNYKIENNKYLTFVNENGHPMKIDLDMLFPNEYVKYDEEKNRHPKRR